MRERQTDRQTARQAQKKATAIFIMINQSKSIKNILLSRRPYYIILSIHTKSKVEQWQKSNPEGTSPLFRVA